MPALPSGRALAKMRPAGSNPQPLAPELAPLSQSAVGFLRPHMSDTKNEKACGRIAKDYDVVFRNIVANSAFCPQR